MVGAFIAGLAGGFVGGYAGAGSRSPAVVVRKQIQTQYRDFDYKRLAQEVIKSLKDERKNAINNRIAEIRQLEESRKCTCAKCGKEIVCWDAYITKQPELLNVDFKFKCDCKSKTVSEVYLRYSYYDDNPYIRVGGPIVRHNAEHPLCFEMAVNANKNAFKDVFEKAYALWETQSDLDKKNGKSQYALEIERLNDMLNDPLGLAEGLGIGTSASNGSTLMLAVDKE